MSDRTRCANVTRPGARMGLFAYVMKHSTIKATCATEKLPDETAVQRRQRMLTHSIARRLNDYSTASRRKSLHVPDTRNNGAFDDAGQ